MSPARPLAILLAAAPTAAGAEALLARAALEAGPVRILLSGAGLAWASSGQLTAPHLDVAVCSQDARAAGWTLEDAAEGVRWSSVATWLAALDEAGRARLWSVLP